MHYGNNNSNLYKISFDSEEERANLLEPESVKSAIVSQEWDENTKNIATKAYNKFLGTYG